MRGTRRGILIASAVAGMFAMTASTPTARADEAETQEKERCYGVNACKGHGDCGGKGYSCAGNNQCKGQGYLNLPKGTCTKIQNGRLTEEPEKKG